LSIIIANGQYQEFYFSGGDVTMLKLFRALITLLTAATLMGCIDSTTEIQIQRDGSGSVTETVYTMRSMERMLEVLSGMAETLVTEDEKRDAPKSRADRRYYVDRAAAMGKGVRLGSLESVKRGDGAEGIKAVYTFTDIRSTAVSPEPSFFIPQLPPPVLTNDPAVVTFEFTSGSPATLTVHLPWSKKAATAVTPRTSRSSESAITREEAAMVRHVLDGFRSHMIVRTADPLKKSNASFQERDRQRTSSKHVILFDLNLGDAVRNETIMDQLEMIGPVRNMEIALERYAGLTGMRVEKQPTVTIEF
jgi:hypothetical protein